MEEVTFHRPTEEMVQFIADNMRDADRIEVEASDGWKPLEALHKSLGASHLSTVACVQGVPCVVFGLVIHDIMAGTGSPWMLGTDGALKHRRQFLTETPQVIEEMLRKCVKLVNHVHVKNRESVRWLRWLGFTLEEPAPYGVVGEEFHRFYMEKPLCAALQQSH